MEKRTIFLVFVLTITVNSGLGAPEVELNAEVCRNISDCRSSGNCVNGRCECNENFYGRNCECSKTGLDTGLCRRDNVTDVECSGRGNCICGQCECNNQEIPEEIVYGPFCECDNFSCDRHNSILCSGPDHGNCECGVCKCLDGWGGAACECSSSIDTCRTRKGICSGHGECRCGRCECEIKEDIRYSGKYCEKCPTCPGVCDELKDCVECQMYKKGLLKDPKDCERNCTLFVPISVDVIKYNDLVDEHLCTFYDEDDCRYQFIYSETVEKNGTMTLHVRAQQHIECPKKASSYLSTVLGFIAKIV